MYLKEHRKKIREKRKVFKLHSLISMANLAIHFALDILEIDFGIEDKNQERLYFFLSTHLVLILIFDKKLREKYRRFIVHFLKNGPW